MRTSSLIFENNDYIQKQFILLLQTTVMKELEQEPGGG